MKIVAFTGRKGNGKNTAAEALINQGFVPIDFADPLRDVVHLVYGVSYEEMNDGALKEMPLTRWPFVSPRYLLQKVGTEMFRGLFDETWVQNHRLRVAEARRQRAPGVVIRDLRFLNEEAYLRTMGNITIVKVENPRIESKADAHVSETQMEAIVPNWTVYNERGIKELQDAVTMAFQS